MSVHPLGGVQSVRLPFRPVVALPEGSSVKLEHGLYARVVSARLERRHGEWGVWLQVLPVSTGEVLTGFGEYVGPVTDLSGEGV